MQNPSEDTTPDSAATDSPEASSAPSAEAMAATDHATDSDAAAAAAPAQRAGLATYSGTVLPEWVDYNGHLRDAFYMLLFSYGADGLMDAIGLDAAGRTELGHSLFTLEVHVSFLHEVKVNTAFEVRAQILGIDAKRVHVGFALYTEDQPEMCAFGEKMLLNVDLSGPRATPFAQPVLALLHPLATEHAALPIPPQVGRAIALPGPKLVP